MFRHIGIINLFTSRLEQWYESKSPPNFFYRTSGFEEVPLKKLGGDFDSYQCSERGGNKFKILM